MALVKASPLGIIAIDLDGNILLWNRAAEEITGWREKEVLGLPIAVIAGEKWVEHKVLCRRILNQKVFHILPMDAIRKDGRRIVISYSSAPVFDSENPIVATMGDDSNRDFVLTCSRCTISQCAIYLCSRSVINRMTPEQTLGPDYIEKISEQIASFTLNALQGMAKSKGRRPPIENR